MPIIKSAKKRVKTARKATVQNAKTKRNFRVAIKQFQAAVASKKNVAEALSEAQSTLDIAVKKGVLHKNRAARKKQQLVSQARAAGATVTTTAKKKAAPAKKKTSAKSTTTAKKTTKKAPAKKTTAKKAPAKKVSATSKK